MLFRSSSWLESMSAQVHTRRLPLRAKEYRTDGTPSREQSFEAMTSFMGSWPVRPDLTSSLLPVALSIVQRLGRSPPVDTSGALRLMSWDYEYEVSRISPNVSSKGLSKKLMPFHSTGSSSRLTQYWSDRLSP